MLVYRPEKRLTADEVLQSDWMVKWALSEYQRSLEAEIRNLAGQRTH